ncbi:MAG TPA: DUF4350 domain-containing protein [Myxococcales bacterium]|nr:DUF4350 domain-containing protein [Myxococcales bacterium]
MKRFVLPALVAVAAVVLAIGYWPKEPTDDSAWTDPDTTYSPGPRGTKAFYLLLQQLGQPVARLRRPSYWQLEKGAVLWNLSSSPLGAVERRWALEFVRRGGTLIAGEDPLWKLMGEAGLGDPDFEQRKSQPVSMDGLQLQVERYGVVAGGLAPPDHIYLASAEGLPAVAAWNVGLGRIVFLGIRDVARDDQIGKGDNGLFFAHLAYDGGARQVFDEFGTGFGDQGIASLFAGAPYRWGLAQLAVALLLLLWAGGARRWPVALTEQVRRRQTSDHVAAVARLWARAGDAGLALEALLRAAADRARGRLGLASGEDAFPAWVAAVRPELGGRARLAWDRARELARQKQPPMAGVRAAAEELARLEREALAW